LFSWKKNSANNYFQGSLAWENTMYYHRNSAYGNQSGIMTLPGEKSMADTY
jgi:hypothetical protein